ncbi:MAG TPA: enolase C-terminal domain-like protein [Jatrophihabitantaceae bacterium]|nr:enolase C-terminal domain-like protein [Jatrophihabitantaceae bacterium]
MSAAPAIDEVEVSVRDFPTPKPEADGTLQWTKTTAVCVTLRAGGEAGLGWTYSSSAAAQVVMGELRDAITGMSALDVGRGFSTMRRACRNIGTRGLVMHAISAVDIAWWDLKARLLGASLCDLLGRQRDAVPVYGSGGFVTMTDSELATEVEHWSELGCTAMKIKIGEGWGSCVERDLTRTMRLRALAGDGVALMVDANGGYSRGQARRVGKRLDELGVAWFEEPVTSDDTEGLRALRDALSCDVAAGEYATDEAEINSLLPVVDCMQLDVTRCGGYTGWLRGSTLAAAARMDVSAHCAPALHACVAASIPNLRHVELFADHERIERELVDGVPDVVGGALVLDTHVRGHGMQLRT